MNPTYPIYIISKSRPWLSRMTSYALDVMRVPYHIVVEPQEYLQYAKVINSKKILVLPFKNLGQGSIPARNWVWEHAVSTGAARHWIMDDNIASFQRLNRNIKIIVASGTIFKAAEDFVDRYTNVGLAGFQYDYFAPRKAKRTPFVLNTRIYSCILINHNLDKILKERWRGKYNEDTDLSIRVLKAGQCTVLFQTFICEKQHTLAMKGGNASELYKGDGRLLMAESLQKQHPDIVTVDTRWDRPQHVVDYSGFKDNALVYRKGIVIKSGVNDYGMEIKKVK